MPTAGEIGNSWLFRIMVSDTGVIGEVCRDSGKLGASGLVAIRLRDGSETQFQRKELRLATAEERDSFISNNPNLLISGEPLPTPHY